MNIVFVQYTKVLVSRSICCHVNVVFFVMLLRNVSKKTDNLVAQVSKLDLWTEVNGLGSLKATVISSWS